LHAAWPALTHFFGFRPDDPPALSQAEWCQYIDQLGEMSKRAAGG
jgi:hypothetical protein